MKLIDTEGLIPLTRCEWYPQTRPKVLEGQVEKWMNDTNALRLLRMREARKKNNLVDTAGEKPQGVRNENFAQLQASVVKEEPFSDDMDGAGRARYQRQFREFIELEP